LSGDTYLQGVFQCDGERNGEGDSKKN
jgi:hypothetical protein